MGVGRGWKIIPPSPNGGGWVDGERMPDAEFRMPNVGLGCGMPKASLAGGVTGVLIGVRSEECGMPNAG